MAVNSGEMNKTFFISQHGCKFRINDTHAGIQR